MMVRSETLGSLDGALEGTLISGEIRVYALGPPQAIQALSLPPAPTREYHVVSPMVAGEIGSKAVSFSSIPREGTDIWSRCSWAVFKHPITPGEANPTLKLKLAGQPPAGTTRVVTVLWLK